VNAQKNETRDSETKPDRRTGHQGSHEATGALAKSIKPKMRTFRIYDNYLGLTESGFRSSYKNDRQGHDIVEQTRRCCSGIEEDDRCKNECHFLLASGIELIDDEGFFPIFGIDCDVEVLCWGGDDVENSTIMVYCKECAAAIHQSRLEWERKKEIELEKQSESERRERAEKEKNQRALLNHWNNLSHIEFEQQCAQLFRDKGFKAELTPLTNDGGIDILLEKDGERGAAQCKAWNQPCGVKEVREFCGVVFSKKLAFGYFISKSGFTDGAIAFLKKINLVEAWSTNHLIEQALKLKP
jgi:hypothetical protein